MTSFVLGRTRVRGRGRMAILGALAVCAATVGIASAAVSLNPFGSQKVGQHYANGILLPSNQWITPLGKRILDDNARLVSSSISPNGKYLAALGWNDYTGTLNVFDLQTHKLISQIALDSGTGSAEDTSVGPDAPLFSSNGSTIWVPQSTWLDKFSFDQNTGTAAKTAEIPLCGSALTSSACNPNIGPSNPSGAYLPAGMALSPAGDKLYVALNGANALGVINTTTDQLTGKIPVGNAPRQVVLADGGKVAYVSNEGGHPARGGQFTNLSDGTPIVSSRKTGGAITGTVSVVNLSAGKEEREIPVGLQPTALYQHGKALFVANSNDDSLSLIDEATNRVAQTVRTNPVPGATVGSYANAISMPDAHHVLVSIGRDNAVALYRYRGLTKHMQLKGLLPTDWYPVEVRPDRALGAGQVVVTNDKGIGARGPESTINKGPDTKPATGHNTYDDTGSVTTFALPRRAGQLRAASRRVFRNNNWGQIKPTNQGGADTVPNVIPKRLGGSSPIKHVVVIVKENRTYDQVLGDLGQGNGDPADAQFGANVTPNFHSLARRFGDLDNFYDEGTLSADGHNWLVQANANDYVEKEFGAFYRSYPSQGGDALAYQRDGFLWNAAQRAHVSVQNFGEYIYNPYNLPSNAPSWDKWYQESQYLEGKRSGPAPIKDPCQYTRSQSDIPSLQAITYKCFPNFQLGIPDQYRVDTWLPQFKKQESSGRMPGLTYMWLMTDHTQSTYPGDPDPYPVAEVADNDLAVGRVVDQISHSRFWKSTAIFVVEDDTQNGVDHVDGHRGPAFVISPYAARGVDDRYYTQLNMVRTIEQILGIKPMNQEDLAAAPMYGAFTQKPDFAPYNVQANQIPLTLGAPGYSSTLTATPAHASAAERRAFHPQGTVPANMRSVYRAWETWGAKQVAQHHFDGPDRVNPQLMNRFDWYAAHNWRIAYPGDPKIYTPDQVPGRKLPAAFLGDG